MRIFTRSEPLPWVLLLVIPLTACTGTSDIVAEDDSTLIGSVGYERTLSDRGAVDARYLATGGSNTEYNAIIQVDGERFDATDGKNSFRLHVLSLHYRFNVINGHRFRLSFAPGVQASHLDINTRLQDTKLSVSDSSFGLAIRQGMSFNFSDELSLEQEISVANQGSNNPLVSLGLWLNYHLNSSSSVKFGFSGEYLGDASISPFGGGSGDGCFSLEVSEGDNCRDSRLTARASGLHIGFRYRM